MTQKPESIRPPRRSALVSSRRAKPGTRLGRQAETWHQSADRRSDPYSLWAVAFEALVGLRLVESEDRVPILVEIASKDPPCQSELVPGAGAAVGRRPTTSPTR